MTNFPAFIVSSLVPYDQDVHAGRPLDTRLSQHDAYAQEYERLPKLAPKKSVPNTAGPGLFRFFRRLFKAE